MASLATLPVETLLLIFNQTTTTGQNCCALTCRRLHNIVYSYYSIDCIFRVDHTSQSAWRFLECLLINPSFGGRISKIRVTWHRRQWRDGTTWTRKWYWTADELVKIRRMCDKWGLESVYYAIRDGLNSEALLPLLLCYTTRLESLDIGRISGPVVEDRLPQSLKNLNAIYNYCVGNESKREPGWECRCDTEASFQTTSKMLVQGTPWFYTTFNPEKWLPGLSSIKKFSYGGCPKKGLEDFGSWPFDNLKKILLLPRLEMLRLSGLGKPKQSFHSYTKPHEKQFSRRSLIKRLEVIDCLFGWDNYRTLAAEVGPVESLRIVIPYTLWTSWYDPLRHYGCKKVATLFLPKGFEGFKEKQFLVEVGHWKNRNIYSHGYDGDGDGDGDDGDGDDGDGDDDGYDGYDGYDYYSRYDDDRVWYFGEPMQMELYASKRLENVDVKFAYWWCQEEGLGRNMAIRTRSLKGKKLKATKNDNKLYRVVKL
ncbi:hypothetical protein TWF506_000549 [Arthrobotrys conoides]|uniref:F-box domain-containing protein n=1 Tax=Arthrobotrys conoides TaxID=74498 RepID=A0AAN8P0D8_9PEZI